MMGLRKGLVYLLSALLLLGLVGGALVVSANLNLARPDKLKTWLHQSKLHDRFLSNTIDEAKKAAGDTEQTGAVSLSDAAVQQAAQAAFPPALVEEGVNTFLDSNYAWLEGRTSTPDFTIDLTAAKQDFATRVGDYVRTYSSGLPTCTTAQLIQLQNQAIDPLSATCRPPGATPEALGAQTTQQIGGSDDFLASPVITADTFGPKTNDQGQPYYRELSQLPQVYRLATTLPWILGGVAALSTLGIIYLAPGKRRGLRRVGIILLVAGLSLGAIKLVADFGFRQLEQGVFNDTNVGQLQHSLTDVAHRAGAALIKTDLLIGGAFLLIALIIFGLLWKTRPPQVAVKDLPSTPDIATIAAPASRYNKKPSRKPPGLIQ